MRIARLIGTTVSGFWLTLIYFIFIAPFRIFARIDAIGWHKASDGSELSQAKLQY